MITVCAWCLPKRVVLLDDGKRDRVVSHGMCDKHLAEWRAKVRAFFAMRQEIERKLAERQAA